MKIEVKRYDVVVVKHFSVGRQKKGCPDEAEVVLEDATLREVESPNGKYVKFEDLSDIGIDFIIDPSSFGWKHTVLTPEKESEND